MFCDGKGGSFCLVEVAGIDHRHSRKHLHKAEILQDLVCGAVLTQGNTGMRGTNLHILFGIGNGLPYLIIYPTR